MSVDATVLLKRIGEGDRAAAEQLLPLVYDELRRRASFYLADAGGAAGHTLQPTALVHEAYIKLVGTDAAAPAGFADRLHFFNAAAEAMRRILVDHARRRGAVKRGGRGKRLDLDDVDVAVDGESSMDFEALDVALTRLQAMDERRYQVVMLRYFAGLTDAQIAEALEVSDKTVQRDWSTAKLFLLAEMQQTS